MPEPATRHGLAGRARGGRSASRAPGRRPPGEPSDAGDRSRDPISTRVAADPEERRTYTIKLHRGVKFHDGSEMTSRDVKASYDKIIKPPPGVRSIRQGEYVDVEAVQAPDPYTVVFRLKWPSASFASSLASPW